MLLQVRKIILYNLGGSSHKVKALRTGFPKKEGTPPVDNPISPWQGAPACPSRGPAPHSKLAQSAAKSAHVNKSQCLQ